MKRMFICTFFIITTLLSAQEQNNFSIWGNFGLGYSALNKRMNKTAIAFNYGLNAKLDFWTLSLNQGNSEELVDMMLYNQKFKSTSILAGISYEFLEANEGETKFFYFAQLGISFIKYEGYITKINKEIPSSKMLLIKENVIGYPIELGIKINLTEILGITVAAYSNFNKYSNMIGGNINIIIGKL